MFLEQAFKEPLYYVAVVLSVMVSISLHELAHGFAAIALGDRTPIETERITLNPLVHMGGVSVVALFLVGIAWGSMPISPTRLRGRFGEAIVAVAGPLSNILLALISLTAMGFWIRHARATGGVVDHTSFNGLFVLYIFGTMNVFLAIFNLLPCPPLDGSHIAANFFPGVASAMRSTGSNSPAIGLFLVVFFFAGRFLMPAATSTTDRYLEIVSGRY